MKSKSSFRSKIPTLEFERAAGAPDFLVAGVDEVGRGCLAGPVVSGAVILPADLFTASDWPAELHEVRDSKLLSPQQRERLAPWIRSYALSWSVGEASVEEIDTLNIYHAAHLSMKRAIEGLKTLPQIALIDGNAVPKSLSVIGLKGQAIVKGDMRSVTIACASILAKVHRDAILDEYEAEYPGYGFGAHKGYSTPAHQKALAEKGALMIHRRSFAPVAKALGSLAVTEPSLQSSLH